MQPVNTEFQQAILDVIRTAKARVEIDLFPTFNSTPPVGSPTSTGTYMPPGYTVTPFPPSAAFNQKLTVDPVAAYQATTNPSYVFPTDGSLGWWASGTSDALGRMPVEAQLTMDYGAVQNVTGFAVYGDPILGYPIDFNIYVSTNQSTWTPVITVAGNTNYIWGRQLAQPINTRYMRIGITRYSKPNAHPVIVEFTTRFLVTSADLLSNRIKSIHLMEEAFYDDATSLPVGNFSAATCDIELHNHDGMFYQRNAKSPFYGFLRPNRKVRIYFGLLVPTDPDADGDGYVWLPKGTYYTRVFSGTLKGITTRIQCWNRGKVLSEAPYEGSSIIQGKTLSELMNIILSDLSIPVAERNIQPTYDIVDYAYFEPAPIWKQLAALATAETGFLFVDEQNRITFKDRYFYYSSRLTAAVQPGSQTFKVKYIGALEIGDPFYVIDGDYVDGFTVLSFVYDSNGVSGTITSTAPAQRGYRADSYVTKNFPAITLNEDNALTDLDDGWSVERMKNSITVTTNPLHMVIDDATGLPPIEGTNLFTRDDKEPLILEPGQSITLKIDFQNKPVITQDPAYPVTVSVLIYDESDAGQIIDNTGTVLDPAYVNKQWVNKFNVTLANPYAWGGYLLLKNNNTVRIVFAQISITGWYLERRGGEMVQAVDQALINDYGEKNYTLDSPYVMRTSHAQGLANHLLGSWSDPMTPLTIPLTGRGLFHLQLGDRIIVRSDTEGLTADANNSHFYIVRQEINYDGTLSGSLDCIAAS